MDKQKKHGIAIIIAMITVLVATELIVWLVIPLPPVIRIATAVASVLITITTVWAVVEKIRTAK